jgi:hypothetical protein
MFESEGSERMGNFFLWSRRALAPEPNNRRFLSPQRSSYSQRSKRPNSSPYFRIACLKLSRHRLAICSIESIEQIHPMRSYLIAFSFSVVVALTGCSKSKTAPPLAETRTEKSASSASASPSTTKPSSQNQVDACSLLTGAEIESVQGAAPVETKPSVNAQRGLTVSQCYFLLPTAVNSIVVTITQRSAGSDARDPKEAWQEIFHVEHENAKGREGEEKEAAKPQSISGLGDEAFWIAQRFGGVLYALKGNRSISVSVGGAGDQASKLQKSRALAEMIVKRL